MKSFRNSSIQRTTRSTLLTDIDVFRKRYNNEKLIVAIWRRDFSSITATFSFRDHFVCCWDTSRVYNESKIGALVYSVRTLVEMSLELVMMIGEQRFFSTSSMPSRHSSTTRPRKNCTKHHRYYFARTDDLKWGRTRRLSKRWKVMFRSVLNPQEFFHQA